MKKIQAIHHAPTIDLENGKFVHSVQNRDVRVLAVAEGYAMVRVKGGMPYVCREKELTYR